MKSRDLSKRQVQRLLAKIRPMLHYLHRLKDRMVWRGFPPDDKVYELVVKAHDDIHHLSIALHYLSCDSGVRGPGEKR